MVTVRPGRQFFCDAGVHGYRRSMPRVIKVLMDLPSAHTYHQATVAAITHAIDAVGGDVVVSVGPTDRSATLGEGVVIGPGSPYRRPDLAELHIRQARENGVPLVAT